MTIGLPLNVLTYKGLCSNISTPSLENRLRLNDILMGTISKVRKAKFGEAVGKWELSDSCGLRVNLFVVPEGMLGIRIKNVIVFI